MSLKDHCAVFQAEVMAIMTATKESAQQQQQYNPLFACWTQDSNKFVPLFSFCLRFFYLRFVRSTIFPFSFGVPMQLFSGNCVFFLSQGMIQPSKLSSSYLRFHFVNDHSSWLLMTVGHHILSTVLNRLFIKTCNLFLMLLLIVHDSDRDEVLLPLS